MLEDDSTNDDHTLIKSNSRGCITLLTFLMMSRIADFSMLVLLTDIAGANTCTAADATADSTAAASTEAAVASIDSRDSATDATYDIVCSREHVAAADSSID